MNGITANTDANLASQLARPVLACGVLLVLLSVSITPTAGAQNVAAVPELIEISEEEAQTEAGQAFTQAQALYRESLGSDDQTTLTYAKEMIALSVRIWGETDPRVAMALTNLALAQAQTGEHGLARENFRAAIRIHEVSANSIITPALINPLRGLGSANVALNELARAIPAYERAIHISHVNSGPNNLEQIEIMNALSRAHLFMDELDTATDIQENVYRLQQRRFDEGSIEYIDALLGRARWYAQVENTEAAIKAYKRLEKLIVRAHGSEDVRLIEPLIELAFVAPGEDSTANTLMNGAQGPTYLDEGRRAVTRAVRVARANQQLSPLVLPATLLRTGDWMIFASEPRKARTAYLEAWALADANPTLHKWRDDAFNKPVRIARGQLRTVHGRKISATPDSPVTAPDRGYVEVAFDLNALGKPINVTVTDSQPPGLMDAYVVKRVKRFSYRPAIINGEPAEHGDLNFRHDFRYNEARLSARDREYIERVREQREQELSDNTTAANYD